MEYPYPVNANLSIASKRIETIKIAAHTLEAMGSVIIPRLLEHAAQSLKHVALRWINAKGFLALPPHLLTLHLESLDTMHPDVIREGSRRMKQQTSLTRLYLGATFQNFTEVMTDMDFLSGA